MLALVNHLFKIYFKVLFRSGLVYYFKCTIFSGVDLSGTCFCYIVVPLEYLYYICYLSSSSWTYSSQINLLNEGFGGKRC